MNKEEKDAERAVNAMYELILVALHAHGLTDLDITENIGIPGAFFIDRGGHRFYIGVELDAKPDTQTSWRSRT